MAEPSSEAKGAPIKITFVPRRVLHGYLSSTRECCAGGATGSAPRDRLPLHGTAGYHGRSCLCLPEEPGWQTRRAGELRPRECGLQSLDWIYKTWRSRHGTSKFKNADSKHFSTVTVRWQLFDILLEISQSTTKKMRHNIKKNGF